ncbi:MAG: hypothetical protein LVQ96_03165 [Thermoplasmatales archaeon]|nr:hypothetical protein [Thermoplasmatales archaeon]MCW6170149.1 hypothetical protein [Thermoplasmatales archaeon]
MDMVILVKIKRIPTKKEWEGAQKIVDKAVKSGIKIENYDTYGAYDSVAVVKGSNKGEEIYLRYVHAVKEWADVQTLPIIDQKLMDKISKEFIK